MKQVLCGLALLTGAASIHTRRTEPAVLDQIESSVTTDIAASKVPDVGLSIMPDTLTDDPIIISEEELKNLNNMTINPPRLRGFNQTRLATHLKEFLDSSKAPVPAKPAEEEDDDER